MSIVSIEVAREILGDCVGTMTDEDIMEAVARLASFANIIIDLGTSVNWKKHDID